MAAKLKNEGDVKKEVKKLLKKHHWMHWMPPSNAYGKAGQSDILALRAGVFMAIETKFGSNKPSVPQLRFLAEVMQNSSFALVVNEKRLDVLAQFLDALDRTMVDESHGKTNEEATAKVDQALREMMQEVFAHVRHAQGGEQGDQTPPEESDSST